MRKRRGISLLEVLMAVFVAATCALIVAATMPIGTVSREKTDNTNRAMSLAQKQMESIRAVGYPNLTAATLSARGLLDSVTPVATNTFPFTNVDNGAGTLDSVAQALPGGAGTVLIEQVDLDLRRIVVTVTWNEKTHNNGAGNNRVRTVRLGTLIANL